MNDFVEYPTEEEKRNSIQRIVEKGVKPNRLLLSELLNVWKKLGFRGLFFGVEDCIFLGIIISLLTWGGIFIVTRNQQDLFVKFLFFASPLFYAIIYLLTAWKEIMNGTYELMMTYRYSLRQITVLRMLVFGGASTFLSVLISILGALMIEKEISVFRIMGISFSALFLYGVLELWIEKKWKVPKSYFGAPVIWVVSSFILLVSGEKPAFFLTQIPTVVFWVISAGLIFIYYKTLKHYYFHTKEGGISYVVS